MEADSLGEADKRIGCECGCCHVPDWGACADFEAGANGRCVYCDHGLECHPGQGPYANGPLGIIEIGEQKEDNDVHHSGDAVFDDERLGELLRREAEKMRLGATGRFPEGKLAENDEGELQFAVASYKGKVIVNFGKPVASLGMSPRQALRLARALRSHAHKMRQGAERGKKGRRRRQKRR